MVAVLEKATIAAANRRLQLSKHWPESWQDPANVSHRHRPADFGLVLGAGKSAVKVTSSPEVNLNSTIFHRLLLLHSLHKNKLIFVCFRMSVSRI